MPSFEKNRKTEAFQVAFLCFFRNLLYIITMKKILAKGLKTLVPLLGFLLLGLALWLLYHSLKNYHYADIVKRVRAIPLMVLLGAMAITVCNYLVLGLYDFLALRYVGKKLPYRRIAFVSFLSYVFSYNIGLSIFGSSALRYRYYSSWGIEVGTIARIITFCIVTFWVGLCAAGGVALLTLGQNSIRGLPLIFVSSKLIGIVLLACVGAYLIASISGKAELRVKNLHIMLPSGKIAASQILVASTDWILAAMTLYVLLPSGKPSFPVFLALFLVAQLMGSTSHVPGGIGVFETVLVLALSRQIPTDALLSSIIVYRGIFYLVPLAVAAIMFVTHEMMLVSHKMTGFAKNAGNMIGPFVPTVLAVGVFIAGTLLLFSGVTPDLPSRLDLLDRFFPLELVELTHFSSSLIGLGLIVIADALRRRVDAAYYISVLLLFFGALFALLKGFEYEETIILLAILALLIPTRRLFFRRGAILDPPSVYSWIVSIAVILGCTVWLGFFAYKHIEYSNELWWIFEFSKDAPRFLRASLGVVVTGIIIASRLLLSVHARFFGITLAEGDSDIRRILANSGESYSSLALLGDKRFYLGAHKSSFIMYGISGRTYVVMGDPIGDEAEFEDLVWSFYEEVRHQGGRIALYEVSARYLSIYLELGLTILKFGEEALVDLSSFTLAGSAAQNFRTAINKMTKAGYSFAVLLPAGINDSMEELRSVSRSWLESRHNGERGFSMGFFDEKYLQNFPVAVVTFAGKIVAFANICPSGDHTEISVDLMRFCSGLPNGIMDFLFVHVILWGKDNDYRKFSLGMAPLSGLEQRKVAPLWNKAVTLVFHSGVESYNFRGLRAFKAKFSPEWIPRYLALSGGFSLPSVAADLVRLMSRRQAVISDSRPKLNIPADGIILGT